MIKKYRKLFFVFFLVVLVFLLSRNFDYISYETGEVDNAGKVIFGPLEQNQVVGAVFYIERSVFVDDYKNKILNFNFEVLKQNGEVDLELVKNVNMYSFPTKGYTRIKFDDPIIDTQGKKLVVSYELASELVSGEFVNTYTRSTSGKEKDTRPRIIYRTNLVDMLRVTIDSYNKDPKFAKAYFGLIALLFLAMITTIVSLVIKNYKKHE